MRQATVAKKTKHKPSYSWAALQGMQAAKIGGVSMLIVHEVHVFTQSAARVLAKKWGLKFVPSDSRQRPGKVFDGRKKEK